MSEGPLAAKGTLTLAPLWTNPSRPVDVNDTTWGAPTQIRTGRHGTYVLDPLAGRVTVLDEVGTVDRRLGRRGNGPGELASPFGLLIAEPMVGVVDRGSVRWFDTTGNHTATARLPFAMVTMAWTLGDRQAMLGSPRGWWIGPLGDSLRLVVPPFPDSHLAPGWTVTAGGSCGRVVPGPSETILRLRCLTLHVQVMDWTGAAIREFAASDQIQFATDAEIAQAESVLRARYTAQGGRPDLSAMSAAFRAEQMREKPRYRDIRASDSILVVWEQMPAELGGGPAILHAFTTAGIYLTRIETAEEWIDFDLRGDRIVALAREPDSGLAYAVAYRLIIPPEVWSAANAAIRP